MPPRREPTRRISGNGPVRRAMDHVAGGEPAADGAREPAGRIKPIANPQAPWVQLRNLQFGVQLFRKMIGRTSPDARDGDLVTVYDRDAVVFGTGMLNRASPVALRMLTFGTEKLEEDFIAARVRAASELRRGLRIMAHSDAYRLVNAEGDRLPGLIVDCFGSVAVVQIMSLGMFRRREEIVAAVKEVSGVERVILCADEVHQRAEAFVLPARRDAADGETTVIHENNIKFHVDLQQGHKTGFFCDQRENRRLLWQQCAGRTVLDVCCYTGGFAIGAAKGGAESVVGVDLDEKAIAVARRNAQLNNISTRTLQWVHADGYAYLRQMKSNGRQYDVVVLDPPKLIADREDFDDGRKAYFDLNKLGMSVVKPGGLLLTCSCSGLLSQADFLDMLRGAARSSGRRLQIWRVSGADGDHPVMTEFPQGWYLKCAWCRVLGGAQGATDVPDQPG